MIYCNGTSECLCINEWTFSISIRFGIINYSEQVQPKQWRLVVCHNPLGGIDICSWAAHGSAQWRGSCSFTNALSQKHPKRGKH